MSDKFDKNSEPSLALRLAMLAASMEITIRETNCAVFIDGTPPLRTQIAWIREAVGMLESAESSDLPSNGAIAHTYGKLKAALTELLRLYDWRNELGRIERDFNHDRKQMTTWLNKYGREKHAAWAVARDTLAGAPDIDALLLHERIQTEAQARIATESATSRSNSE